MKLRYLPSAVIITAVSVLAACAPPLPPFRGPTPVPIPWVAPLEVCVHHTPGLTGARFQFTIPQKGIWSFDWQNSLGVWVTHTSPYWFEPGQTMTIETPSKFHVTWAPSTTQGTPWYVVSPDYIPVSGPPLCPDF